MKKFKKVASVEIPAIDTVLSMTPRESKNFISKSLEIVHQISLVLKERGLNQKSLAQKLKKSEPEISKWLSGTHNFTIRTLTAIETILEQEIVVTPHKVSSDPLKYTANLYRATSNARTSSGTAFVKYSIKEFKHQKSGQVREVA